MNKKQLSALTERVRNAHITLDVGDRHALVSILEEFAQELDEGGPRNVIYSIGSPQGWVKVPIQLLIRAEFELSHSERRGDLDLSLLPELRAFISDHDGACAQQEALTDEQREQLELITRCDPSFVLMYLEEGELYDVKLVSKVFDLAKERARA